MSFKTYQGEEVDFPSHLFKTHIPRQYRREDRYAHLGKIGYTVNTYQFTGPNLEENNLYGSQHMKKTMYLEELRRRIIAEREGISSTVDKDSVAGTDLAYRVNNSSTRKKPIYYSSSDDDSD